MILSFPTACNWSAHSAVALICMNESSGHAHCAMQYKIQYHHITCAVHTNHIHLNCSVHAKPICIFRVGWIPVTKCKFVSIQQCCSYARVYVFVCVHCTFADNQPVSTVLDYSKLHTIPRNDIPYFSDTKIKILRHTLTLDIQNKNKLK